MARWQSWREHFETNAARPRPEMWDDRGVPERARAAVAATLARFQLGETGEGRIANEIDRSSLPTIDDDYRRALKLFVAEEGRHARVLGDGVRILGGETIGKSTSQRAFTHGRRLLGMRTKLLTLLAAEVVGIGFYRALVRGLGRGSLRAALEEIADDEAAHLRFHAEFFKRQVDASGGPGRLAFRAAWWPLCLGATTAVLQIEAGTLDALGVSVSELRRSYVSLAGTVDRIVLEERSRRPVAANCPTSAEDSSPLAHRAVFAPL